MQYVIRNRFAYLAFEQTGQIGRIEMYEAGQLFSCYRFVQMLFNIGLYALNHGAARMELIMDDLNDLENRCFQLFNISRLSI